MSRIIKRGNFFPVAFTTIILMVVLVLSAGTFVPEILDEDVRFEEHFSTRPSHIKTNDEARALWKALFSDDGNPAVTKELQYIDDSLPTFKEMMENNVIDQKIAADVWEKSKTIRDITDRLTGYHTIAFSNDFDAFINTNIIRFWQFNRLYVSRAKSLPDNKPEYEDIVYKLTRISYSLVSGESGLDEFWLGTNALNLILDIFGNDVQSVSPEVQALFKAYANHWRGFAIRAMRENIRYAYHGFIHKGWKLNGFQMAVHDNLKDKLISAIFYFINEEYLFQTNKAFNEMWEYIGQNEKLLRQSKIEEIDQLKHKTLEKYDYFNSNRPLLNKGGDYLAWHMVMMLPTESATKKAYELEMRIRATGRSPLRRGTH